MIGSYSDPKDMDDWYRSALPTAADVLAKYPILNSFLNGFSGYESKAYKESRNFVLLNCFPTPKGLRVKEQLDEMAYYEKALGTFDVEDWPAGRRDELISRVQSDDFDVGLSAYTEFMVAQRLADMMGKSLVTLYPKLSNGKISDILVEEGSERLYLEIGNLSDSMPERIIERILNAGAAYLGPKVNGNRYFQVEVDTANLVFDAEGYIDEQASASKLRQEVDDFALSGLAEHNGWIDIGMAAEVIKNLAMYDRDRLFMPEYSEIVDALQGPLSPWASRADFSGLGKGTLVQSVISLPSSSPVMEFHVKEFFPSRATSAQMKSFANHVVRHVKAQVSSAQIEEGKANAILVQGYNWLIRVLSVGEAVKVTVDGIRAFFDANEIPDLYGVGFFSLHPADGYFVVNKKARANTKLVPKTVKALEMRVC